MFSSGWDLTFLFSHLAIAVLAVVHVFVVQLAVGAGFFLVVTESLAYRSLNLQVLGFLRRYSPVLLLGTLVVGVATRVGLWLALAMANPDATLAMLRIFAWGWAAEWAILGVALAAALLYVYTWERLDHASHLRLGWIYCASSWLGLAVLNATMAFLLTPGRWLDSRSFWDALFNPSALPSLALRTLLSFALVGLFALYSAARLAAPGQRYKMVRYAAYWLAPPFILMPAVLLANLAALPVELRQGPPSVMALAIMAVAVGAGLSVAVFLLALLGFSQPAMVTGRFAAVVLLLGLLAAGATEWEREALRRPLSFNPSIPSPAATAAKPAPLPAAPATAAPGRRGAPWQPAARLAAGDAPLHVDFASWQWPGPVPAGGGRPGVLLGRRPPHPSPLPEGEGVSKEMK